MELQAILFMRRSIAYQDGIRMPFLERLFFIA
jgi:hypothetical protein